MVRRKEILAFMIVMLFTTGCTSRRNVKTSPTLFFTPTPLTPTLSSSATITAIASPTYTRTHTPLIPSATPTHTRTPTPLIPSATPTISSTLTLSTSVMRSQCLEITDSLGPKPAPEGVLLFKNDNNTDAFLWNMKTGTRVRFHRKEGDRLLGFDVSPDRTRVVYLYSSDAGDRIIIATADGQPIWSGARDWLSWFDHDRLVGSVTDSDGRFLYLVLLNPFTGDRVELHPDFPNLYMGPDSPKWHGAGVAVYDPTLTRAVYPECDPECLNGKPGWPIVLWDIETGQVLARLITMDGFGGTPIWSPDGKQFIIATKLDPNDPYFPPNGFYSVSREGQIKQLAYFPDMAILNSYSLSPDGRLVAFWIAAKSKMWDEAHLAVLDTTTGDIINYCFANTTPGNLVQPIWSPDGTQLLLNVPDPVVMTLDHGPQRNALLVDLVQGWAAQIAENLTPVGWLVGP